MGPKVQELEEAIAAYCGTRFAIGCASGSDAILLALMAVGVGPGDEVICPAFTFFATAGSIARLGATPVWVDIDPATYNMDPDHLREVAARCTKLKAIMPVHLYGQTAAMDEINAIGCEHGVSVIEDAAQAIGTRDVHGTPIGGIGHAGCFSFFPTKNLGGFGDGGVVTTNDANVAELVRKLRVHGGHDRYYHDIVGMNSRLDALQAAVLLVKLRHLESWHAQRRANADFYDRAFGAAGATDARTPLAESGAPLRTPYRLPDPSRHIFNQYVIRVPASCRDELRDHLRERGIVSEVYYPLCLHRQNCFAHLGGRDGDLPHSELAAKQVLALPIYAELTEAQLDHVAGTINAFLAQRVATAVS
jgi:dTDP-4-amino-4,6-dideoxygalactose transaminase